MKEHKELSRFTGSGKTFFFNVGKARNNTEYLAINAMYGQGNRERVVLFPPHLLEFRKHLEGAITSLTGASFDVARTPAPVPIPPAACPACGWGHTAYGVTILSDMWYLWCQKCGETVHEYR